MGLLHISKMYKAAISIKKMINGELKLYETMDSVLTFAKAIDPTGISDIASAFLHPTCLHSDDTGFGDEEWSKFKFY